MPKNTRKIAIAGAATIGAAALAFSVVPADAQTTTTDAVSSARVAYSAAPVQAVKASVTDQLATTSVKVDAIEAKKKAAAAAAAKKKAAAEAAAKAAAAKKKAAAAAAAKKAAAARKAQAAASRSTERVAVKKAATKTYANNLDGWIKHSLDIMKSKGIPGSYSGLHRNIIRESSGNPKAINNWDINAINGIPSKGLLQVIPPTFAAYHVAGTSWNIYDPVANITAAANYAADKYGTIDNVDSAY
ncbi:MULTISPECIES: transglycosylase SLT domain-containing protein [unclassified Streptomyces]|uniref:transglycosylase SLT domain-containing protein n=1 Tax=unclassified Streptomyces TaxID=2593676 RepID=UPI00225A7480|nr:transglycosylase SLT domain-containing protein [Streptomyces sp. NBC_00103]MCX5370883.1 transglycosylase SLT domain-containing protein [Streptomyces sp. NBC_00103]